MRFSRRQSEAVLHNMGKDKSQRAFELDFIRGFAIFMMMLMHFSWDMYYLFGISAFGIIDTDVFMDIFHPLYIIVFVGVSGICCTFSRSNIWRGLKLLAFATIETVATIIAQYCFGFECLILFNVLHLLTVGILLYSLISFVERKFKLDPRKMNIFMAFIGVWMLMIGVGISDFESNAGRLFLLPFGVFDYNTEFLGQPLYYMADYLPIFPNLGLFFVGAVIGRTIYSDKKTLFGNASATVRKITRPFEFIGRHSLIVYAVHQPIILGLAYLIYWIIT